LPPLSAAKARTPSTLLTGFLCPSFLSISVRFARALLCPVAFTTTFCTFRDCLLSNTHFHKPFPNIGLESSIDEDSVFSVPSSFSRSRSSCFNLVNSAAIVFVPGISVPIIFFVTH